MGRVDRSQVPDKGLAESRWIALSANREVCAGKFLRIVGAAVIAAPPPADAALLPITITGGG